MSAVLDTHTVLWYLEYSQELSVVARTTIEDAIRDARDVHVSAISLVETVYLVERRRLPLAALERLRSALGVPHSKPGTDGTFSDSMLAMPFGCCSNPNRPWV